MIPSVVLLANTSGPGGGGGGGGGGASASIDNRTVYKSGVLSPTATYELNSNGNVYNHAGTLLEGWLDSGTSSSLEARATVTAGTTPTGSAVGSYLNLGTTRSWSQNAIVGGDVITCTLTVEIRPSGGGTVIDSAVVTITAENTDTG